jgi:hypothetical protein
MHAPHQPAAAAMQLAPTTTALSTSQVTISSPPTHLGTSPRVHAPHRPSCWCDVYAEGAAVSAPQVNNSPWHPPRYSTTSACPASPILLASTPAVLAATQAGTTGSSHRAVMVCRPCSCLVNMNKGTCSSRGQYQAW